MTDMGGTTGGSTAWRMRQASGRDDLKAITEVSGGETMRTIATIADLLYEGARALEARDETIANLRSLNNKVAENYAEKVNQLAAMTRDYEKASQQATEAAQEITRLNQHINRIDRGAGTQFIPKHRKPVIRIDGDNISISYE